MREGAEQVSDSVRGQALPANVEQSVGVAERYRVMEEHAGRVGGLGCRDAGVQVVMQCPYILVGRCC